MIGLPFPPANPDPTGMIADGNLRSKVIALINKRNYAWTVQPEAIKLHTVRPAHWVREMQQ
jgi:hypothetical protein